MMLYYLAYGSNLHPLRLSERVPSARLIGTAKVMGYALAFHKKGRDGSAKCSFVPKAETALFGAVYTIAHEEKAILDRVEGLGNGYAEKEITVRSNGDIYPCFTYQAQQHFIDGSLLPYHWYKQLVLLGANHLNFPENYRFFIASRRSVADPDGRRKEQNEILIKRIMDF